MQNRTARRLVRVLIGAGVIRPEDGERVLRSGAPEPLAHRLVKLGLATEEQIASGLARALRLPLVRLGGVRMSYPGVACVSGALAKRYSVFPLEVTTRTLQLAMADPLDLDAIRDVAFRSRRSVRPVIATISEIEDAIARCYAPAHHACTSEHCPWCGLGVAPSARPSAPPSSRVSTTPTVASPVTPSVLSGPGAPTAVATAAARNLDALMASSVRARDAGPQTIFTLAPEMRPKTARRRPRPRWARPMIDPALRPALRLCARPGPKPDA